MERREEQVNEAVRGNRNGAKTPETLLTKLNRLSEQARSDRKRKFNNIAFLITTEMLEWSFRQLRRDAATGVDGITVTAYEKNLEDNLKNLHQRLKAKQYRAEPLRRVYIEKEDGKKRPLSIPSLEDKIVQKAVAELLNRIYENDFLSCSYGYRPKRSAHDALDDIQKDITFGKVTFGLDADIRDYFGTIVRKQLMDMLQKRVTDKNLLQLIGKWLQVGVIEDGRLLLSENGTYQGSIVSPILANLYLHEVLDLWIEEEVRPRMKGDMKLYRYADDFIVTFECAEDAHRFLEVLPKRFEKYGLVLHPEKTKLIEFGRSTWSRYKGGGPKPETFNFLGLTHICGSTRKGMFMVRVKTMQKRLSRGLQRVALWCKANRHQHLVKQVTHLRSVLRGHYAYYGRRNNYDSLSQFYEEVVRIWKKWLGRRSNNGYVNWPKMHEILKRNRLPKPRIVHGAFSSRSQVLLFGEFI
jgi:RNA-directed DNA polymerase